MKTAMQNLIAHFDRIYDTKCSEQEKPILASVLNFANDSLEKEKEQIIDAYVEGGEDILLDRSENNIDFFGNCHKYYNKIYK